MQAGADFSSPFSAARRTDPVGQGLAIALVDRDFRAREADRQTVAIIGLLPSQARCQRERMGDASLPIAEGLQLFLAGVARSGAGDEADPREIAAVAQQARRG
jgi:hypothetical protein